VGPDLACEQAFEAADDLGFCSAFSKSAGDVGLRRFVVLHADDHRAVERSVGLSVSPRLSRCRLVLPDEAGIGETPHSFANAASERTRSGLSPATMSISAATSAPTPNAATSFGAAFSVRSARIFSWPVISVLRSSQRRGDRAQGVFSRRGDVGDRTGP
jgi:hypothetical protein